MTTLRRETRKRIENVLNHYYGEELSTSGGWVFSSVVAEEIVEEINSKNPKFFEDEKPKIDLARSDPAWAILSGAQIDNSENILAKEAKDSFERDMKFNPLPWSSTKSWEKLEKFVVQEYRKDKLIFAKYKTWQQNEGKYTALSNGRIKAKPEDFIACFPDFLAHSAMYGRKPAQQRPVETDDNDIPISY